MSFGDRAQSTRHLYMQFHCACGRELRVKRELKGTEVRCWDCRQMVRVPEERTTNPVLSTLLSAIRETFRLRLLTPILALAALATLALCFPPVGPGLEAVVMLAVAACYGFFIADASEPEIEEEPEDAARWTVPRLALRIMVVVAFGFVLALPWLPRLNSILPDDSPIRLTMIELLIFVGTLLVAPPAMLLAFGHGAAGPLGPLQVLRIPRNHPLATLLALALLPLALVSAEIAVFVVSTLFGWLPYLVLELFPNAEALAESMGIDVEKLTNIGGWPDSRFFRMYAVRLGHGYTLTGAIPPSMLGRPNQIRYVWQILPSDTFYIYHRVFCTMIISLISLLALGLQARWLGTLARVESGPPPAS